MISIKGKTALIIVAALAVIVAAAVLFKIEQRRVLTWRVINPDRALLQKTPPQVRLMPTKFVWGGGWTIDGEKMIGIGVQLESILQVAYKMPAGRIIADTGLPPVRYDFICNLEKGSTDAVQREIERETGLEVKRVLRKTDVLLLRQLPTGSNLKSASETSGQSMQYRDGSRYWIHQPTSALAQALEQYLHTPVVDETDLTGNYDFHLPWTWERKPDTLDILKRDLSDQLGLRLEPDQRLIEVLVIGRARR